jgi:hypothetical protein
MTKADFWVLVQSTRRRESEEHVERLIANLVKRGEAEILSFAKWWFALHDQAYTWELWGAAYIMNGGCSDDGFIDFRSWLLLQGQTVYEAALKDSDSLSKVRVEMEEASCECYPAQRAFEQATGVSDGDAFYRAFKAKYGPGKSPRELGAGWDFDDEAEMTKRYPRLTRKFADS